MRRNMQFIFQDPYASLNPRMTIGEIVSEPLIIHNVMPDAKEREEYVRGLLDVVGLQPGAHQPLPARVLRRPAPARGHCPRPRAQAQAHHLRRARLRPGRLHPGPGAQPPAWTCRRSTALAYLFIAHDLTVVQHISDRIGVMYLGNMMEYAGLEGPLRPSAPPLHAVAALRRAGARSGHPGHAQAHRPCGRPAVAHRRALRLLLPHALPHGVREVLPGAPGVPRGGAWPLLRLPLCGAQSHQGELHRALAPRAEKTCSSRPAFVLVGL